MRAFIVFLCVSASQVIAGPGKPEITIGINSEGFGKGDALAALEPDIKWQTSGTFSGYDVEGGVQMKVQDMDEMPFSLWGKVKRTVGMFDLSAKASTKSTAMNKFSLDLQAAAPTSGTAFQLTGTADSEDLTASPGTIKVTQKIDAGDVGKFTVVPKYNFGSSKADVKVSFARDDTVVTVDADLDKQKLTLSQAIGDNNVIVPSITSDGDVELEYTRSIGTGALTAGYKPDSYVGLTYEDGPWSATVTAPITGLYKPTGVKPSFSIRRSVDVTGAF